MEQRTQFTFYESFFKAVSRIKKKADRADAYDAICAYALCGTEPNLDLLPDSAAIAFELIKPNLDSSKRKANSGKKGGEAKQTASKPEASVKQTASKKEKEKEKEKENECYNPLTPSQEAKFSPELLEAVKTWLRYKHERKDDYTPTGLEAMTSEIRSRAEKHGDAAVIALIEHCMAQNWKGIIWEKIATGATQPNRKGREGTGPFAQGATAGDNAAEDLARMQKYCEKLRTEREGTEQ